MNQNPTNDPVIEITSEELQQIIRTRECHKGLSPGYPKTGGGCTLTIAGRLWYVAEFIVQAKLRRRNPAEYQSWRDRAHAIAQEVVRKASDPDQFDIEPFCDLLREVANALEGKRREIVTTAREDAYQEVMRLAARYSGMHGKLPTQKALLEFTKSNGIKLRKADISAAFNMHAENGGIKFPTLRKK